MAGLRLLPRPLLRHLREGRNDLHDGGQRVSVQVDLLRGPAVRPVGDTVELLAGQVVQLQVARDRHQLALGVVLLPLLELLDNGGVHAAGFELLEGLGHVLRLPRRTGGGH